MILSLSWAVLGSSSSLAQDLEHPRSFRDEQAPLGPLCSETTADGFALNIGSRDGLPHPARLLVFDANARPRPGDPPLRTSVSPAASWHLLRVSGLLPAHRYRYVLQLQGHPDSHGEVSTAPVQGARTPLLLAVFGDERDAVFGVSATARAIIAGVLADTPDLVLGTGDLVPTGGRRADWLSLLSVHAPLLAQLPYYPALGNHELIGDGQAQMWKTLFPLAARGYYAVRYGQALIVVLNSNRPGDREQTGFLAAELQRAQGDKTVRARLVLMHHAPLSVSWHCGAAPYLTAWMALFERYHVDAVLAGHDHTYQRLERNGVAYVVSGGGGAPLYEQGRCDPHDELALQHYSAAHHYVLVRITPSQDPLHDTIAISARAPQGQPFDAAILPLPHARTALVRGEQLGSGEAPPARLRLARIWHLLKRHKLLALFCSTPLLVLLARLVWRRRRRATRDER
jgi:hypothetical protein